MRKKNPELMSEYDRVNVMHEKLGSSNSSKHDLNKLLAYNINLPAIANLVYSFGQDSIQKQGRIITKSEVLSAMEFDYRDWQVVEVFGKDLIRTHLLPLNFIKWSSITNWTLGSFLYIKTRVALDRMNRKDITMSDVVQFLQTTSAYVKTDPSTLLVMDPLDKVKTAYFKNITLIHQPWFMNLKKTTTTTLLSSAKTRWLGRNKQVHVNQNDLTSFTRPIYVLGNALETNDMLFWEILCNTCFMDYGFGSITDVYYQRHLFKQLCIRRNGHWIFHPILGSLCGMNYATSPVSPTGSGLRGMTEVNDLTRMLFRIIISSNDLLKKQNQWMTNTQAQDYRCTILKYLSFLSVFDKSTLYDIINGANSSHNNVNNNVNNTTINLSSTTSSSKDDNNNAESSIMTMTMTSTEFVTYDPISGRNTPFEPNPIPAINPLEVFPVGTTEEQIKDRCIYNSECYNRKRPESNYRWSVYRDIMDPTTLLCMFHCATMSPSLSQAYDAYSVHPMLIWQEMGNGCRSMNDVKFDMYVRETPLVCLLCHWIGLDDDSLQILMGLQAPSHIRIDMYRSVMIALLWDIMSIEQSLKI